MIIEGRTSHEKQLKIAGFHQAVGFIRTYKDCLEQVKDILSSVGGSLNRASLQGNVIPFQILYDGVIPSDQAVKYYHASGGDRRLKNREKVMQNLMNRSKHYIDLLDRQSEDPKNAWNTMLTVSRVASELGGSRELYIVLRLKSSSSKHSYASFKNVLASIRTRLKVSNNDLASNGEVMPGAYIVKCNLTQAKEDQFKEQVKKIGEIIYETSSEDDLNDNIVSLVYKIIGITGENHGHFGSAKLTPALEIIKARVSNERHNLIDVAWHVGGNSQGWEVRSIERQVKEQIEHAEKIGLTNAKLLGYWKAKRDDEFPFLDAVLTAKMLADNDTMVERFADFLGCDVDDTYRALKEIKSETNYVLDKIKRNQTYFSRKNDYILGEFQKA